MVLRVSDTVELARWWWAFILRGVVAIIFGVLVFVSPPFITIPLLVLFFGAYVLVDGVFDIVAAFQNRERERSWWLSLLEGIAGIVAGLIALILSSRVPHRNQNPGPGQTRVLFVLTPPSY